MEYSNKIKIERMELIRFNYDPRSTVGSSRRNFVSELVDETI